MSSISKLLNIKNKLWGLTQYYLENYTPNFNLFDKEERQNFLNELEENKLIGKYQWKVKSTHDFSLLSVYFSNFICSFVSFNIKNIEKFIEKNVISNEFINAPELKDFFNGQYEKLEREILLSEELIYKILIPTFRIYFPEDKDTIILDSEHIIRNIFNKENPHGITKFKKPPRYWEPFDESPGVFKEANACFEIILKIKKRLVTDPPYDHWFVPFYPIHAEFDIFGEKVRSISDFFISYSLEDRFLPFTFGHKFYIVLPPFSQLYSYTSSFIGHQFPYPAGMLSLKDTKTLSMWKECWKKNYTYFYNNLYDISKDPEIDRLFRYTMNTLRIIDNIYYLSLKDFLLVSTLEGLLFKKTIQKKLNVSKYNKSEPTAETFLKVCRDMGKKWRFLLDEKYFIPAVFNQRGHDKDLKDFILSAFQYRNNIAHPEEKRNIKFKPTYLYDKEPLSRYEYILGSNILEWFRKFLRFLINTWVKKKFKDQDGWYKYLDTLFS